MKVKNGIASSVSFCMMPNTRSGRAWNRLPPNMPASMPMKPNSSPVAASPKATGMPESRNTNSPANISGTKFWARNAAIQRPLSGVVAAWRAFNAAASSWRSASAASSSASSSSSDLPASSVIGSAIKPRR